METSFFHDLMAKSAESRSVRATFRVAPLQQPEAFLDILGLDEVVLSETAKRTLHAFENREKDSSSFSKWTDFKWKVTAFIKLQDIFDAPIMTGSFLNAFHLWYFYFESKHILNEAAICGFNGLYMASNTLLRLFLEFNILQNYYYRVVSDSRSYEPLERYFKTHCLPRWSTVLKKALPQDSFAKPIRFRLQMHLKGLSQHFAHPYHPDHSPRQHASIVAMPSFEGIFFWEGIRILLDAILWTYYANFPMLFHPKDTLNKFGFNAPIGLFIDELGSHILRKSLKEEEYDLFFRYSSLHDTVLNLTEWYESFDTLTEEQIIDTWNKGENGEFRSILAGYALQMAKLRAMREVMALKPAADVTEENVELDYDAFTTHSFWEKISKHKKQ